MKTLLILSVMTLASCGHDDDDSKKEFDRIKASIEQTRQDMKSLQDKADFENKLGAINDHIRDSEK